MQPIFKHSSALLLLILAADALLAAAILVVKEGPAATVPGQPGQAMTPLIGPLTKWDGRWYLSIVEDGYAFSESKQSNVAFFPAYPGFVWLLSRSGLSPSFCAVLCSHVCHTLALLLLYWYVYQRTQSIPIAGLAFLACLLYPPGLFFRMAYSESMFLLVAVLYFWLSRQVNAIEITSLIGGLASAIRPVGVCLLFPALLKLWQDRQSVWSFAVQSLLVALVGTWGILLFTAFQWLAFDEPFAWVKSQNMWFNTPPVSWPDKLVSLLTLKPLWASYIPGTEVYWHQPGQPDFPLFSLRFMNPVFFVVASALVVLGGYKRWLNSQELVFSAGVIVIPYITRGHDMCMESQARFTSVVFPVYLVIAILLSKISRPWQIVYFATSAFFLCVYTAFFCAGYVFI